MADRAIILLLLVGLYFPSSAGGLLSLNQRGTAVDALFYGAAGLIALLLLVVISVRAAPWPAVIVALSIQFVLALATLSTPLTDYAHGAWVPYFLLTLLLCTDHRAVRSTKLFDSIFLVVSVANISMAAGLMYDWGTTRQFVVDNYSAFYPQLVPAMLASGKPVLTFATHSLAAFSFYLFYLLWLLRWEHRRHVYSLAFAAVFLFLCASLQSFTSYLFVLIGLVQFAVGVFRPAGVGRRALVVTLAFAALIASAISDSGVDEVAANLAAVVFSDTNGIIGRYSERGNLAPNLTYISEHPMQPVGVGFSPSLFFGDSGPLEHLLRGGPWLLAAVYIGFWQYLRRNLGSRLATITLFVTYAVFEIGFSNLTYWRTLAILPFVTAYVANMMGEKPAVLHATPVEVHRRALTDDARLRTWRSD